LLGSIVACHRGKEQDFPPLADLQLVADVNLFALFVSRDADALCGMLHNYLRKVATSIALIMH
jgi:hypothetical protein